MEQATCKVTEFHNTEFGAIRVIEDQGRLLFCGTDVAFALGYSKPRNAINMHCKGALKKGALTAGGVQKERKSIHERLKINKGIIAKQQGKDSKGVELA